MKIVPIQFNRAQPAYIQIVNAFESMLQQSQITHEERLPSIRKLAKDLRVSNSTVIAAYQLMEQKGLVFTKQRSGTYLLPPGQQVRAELSRSDSTHVPPDCIDLSGTAPSLNMFPTKDFKDAINGVLDTDGGNAFAYQASEGFLGLRKQLASYASDAYGIRCSAQDILITSGAQQAIDLISKTLIDPSDVVLAENPTYRGAQSSFLMRGAKVLGVPVDCDGINISILKQYLSRYRPRIVYTMPVYQTPTGICMSEQKRKELLRLADEFDFYILEEDLLSDLCLDDNRYKPLKSQDDTERVIYIKSFSKIIMPGIRMGFMIAPKSIAPDINDAKIVTDISASGLIQRALEIYLQSGKYKNHYSNMVGEYKRRLDVVMDRITPWKSMGVSYKRPGGGFGIWIKLPAGLRDEQVFGRCLNKKVLIAKGSDYYVSPMHQYDRYIRISYASVEIQDLEKGLSVVGGCISSLVARNKQRRAILV